MENVAEVISDDVWPAFPNAPWHLRFKGRPWTAAERLDAALDEIECLRSALRYIAQPTMGYDASCTPEEFARTQTADTNARLALETCIRTATVALANADQMRVDLDALGAVA